MTLWRADLYDRDVLDASWMPIGPCPASRRRTWVMTAMATAFSRDRHLTTE